MKTELVLTKNKTVVAGRKVSLREGRMTTPFSWEPAWQWLRRQNLEAVFTAVTLMAMLLAWGADRLELPLPISRSLYCLAYITGGAFGVKQGLASLRAGVIDIDLLMILAALGAALAGAPFEGALLLFLFSLSNVL